MGEQYTERREEEQKEEVVRSEWATVTSDHTLPRATPSAVVCSGDGLKFGYMGHSAYSQIDTTRAGPGELTVFCEGPKKSAFCELLDLQNGTFELTVQPQEPGMHSLYVKYEDIDVPGSPFNLRISTASMVRVDGPGLQHGILNKYKGEFILDARDAGGGEASIKVGGPRGAFKVKAWREDKELRCSYNPQHPGLYVIKIAWCGDSLPDSPFTVFLGRNREEVKQYLAQAQSLT